jgi:hypothetical protein
MFCEFFMTFIFENDVNVALKSNKQNKHNKKIFAVLKVTDENSRIQSRIRYGYPDPLRICGSGSVPECQGSATLVSWEESFVAFMKAVRSAAFLDESFF